MWNYYNPNPISIKTIDCSVRALCKALDKNWEAVYVELVLQGFLMCTMPSSNSVWGSVLRKHGFYRTAPDGTNTGVYPEAAKTAIKNMLGISEGGGSTKIYQHSVNLTIRASERDYITGTILYSSSSAPMTAEEFIEKVKDTWLPLQGYNVTNILLGLSLGQYLYYFLNGSNTSPTYIRIGASSITSLTDVVVEL